MSVLQGVRVIELCHERISFAGKLLADMGADVVLVEAPGGCPTRGYPPFVENGAGEGESLWFWHYNTSKRGVTLNMDEASDLAQFKQLVAPFSTKGG